MNAAGRRVTREKADGPRQEAEELSRGEEGMVDTPAPSVRGSTNFLNTITILLGCSGRCSSGRSASDFFTLLLPLAALWRREVRRPQVPVLVAV